MGSNNTFLILSKYLINEKVNFKILIRIYSNCFGVSLSFYVENYIENKKKDGLKNQSLNRILQNIETDMRDNNINLKFHSRSLSSSLAYKNKKKLSNFSRDTVGYHFSKARMKCYFVDNQEEYRTLQSSGYMELIENDELVKNLQKIF